MPNHPPKTYSHEDVLFIEETLRHCSNFVTVNRKSSRLIVLEDDIDRCIRILKSEDEPLPSYKEMRGILKEHNDE